MPAKVRARNFRAKMPALLGDYGRRTYYRRQRLQPPNLGAGKGDFGIDIKTSKLICFDDANDTDIR